MMWLSTSRKILWSVAPVHPKVYVGRVPCADLEDSAYPVLDGFIGVLLFLLLRNEYVLANFKLGVTDCGMWSAYFANSDENEKVDSTVKAFQQDMLYATRLDSAQDTTY